MDRNTLMDYIRENGLHPHLSPPSKQVCYHALEFFMLGQRTSFRHDLIQTICRADTENQRKLARGFPEYVRAVDLWKNAEHGVAMLVLASEIKLDRLPKEAARRVNEFIRGVEGDGPDTAATAHSSPAGEASHG